MRLDIAFGLIALLPASINPAPAPGPSWVNFCSGDTLVHQIAFNLPRREPPGGATAPCCAKGCHGGTRRRGGKSTPEDEFDPAQ
jgi:hypothetical protein